MGPFCSPLTGSQSERRIRFNLLAHGFSHYDKCNSRFHLEENRLATRTFRKKKQQQSRVFFDVIIDVYTHVDDRERARARETNFVERKT